MLNHKRRLSIVLIRSVVIATLVIGSIVGCQMFERDNPAAPAGSDRGAPAALNYYTMRGVSPTDYAARLETDYVRVSIPESGDYLIAYWPAYEQQVNATVVDNPFYLGVRQGGSAMHTIGLRDKQWPERVCVTAGAITAGAPLVPAGSDPATWYVQNGENYWWQDALLDGWFQASGDPVCVIENSALVPGVTETPAQTPSFSCAALGGKPLGGYCWFMGNADQSCTAVCAAHNLTCNLTGTAWAGSNGTQARCEQVLTALNQPADATAAPGANPVARTDGCAIQVTNNDWFRGTDPTACGTSAATVARACACK